MDTLPGHNYPPCTGPIITVFLLSPLQEPFLHLSEVVQGFPSLQLLVLLVKTHPLDALQESFVQAFPSLHFLAPVPTQLPLEQISPVVHLFPSLQDFEWEQIGIQMKDDKNHWYTDSRPHNSWNFRADTPLSLAGVSDGALIAITARPGVIGERAPTPGVATVESATIPVRADL